MKKIYQNRRISFNNNMAYTKLISSNLQTREGMLIYIQLFQDCETPLTDLFSFQTVMPKPTSHNGDSCSMECESNDQISLEVGTDEVSLTSESVISDLIPESTNSQEIKICKSAKLGEKAPQEIISLWKENGFCSLIIAAPQLDMWSLVIEILPLLSNSAPFAIYHQYLQPLATCMHNLQVGKMAVGLQISEPWLREYQAGTAIKNPSMYADEWIRWVHSQRDQDMYQQLIDSFYRITRRDWNYCANKIEPNPSIIDLMSKMLEHQQLNWLP